MGKNQFENYYDYIGAQAEMFVKQYIEEVLESVKDGNTDLFTFMDEYVWQWVDNDFIYVDLLDSAHILDQSDNVETDAGLWEGLEPKKAVESQAFFTYKNDLLIGVGDNLKNELESKIQELEEELENLEDELEGFDNELTKEQQEEVNEIGERVNELELFINNLDDAIEGL